MELFTFGKFGCCKSMVIVVCCKFDDGVVEEKALDHYFARELAAARSTSNLSDELKDVFVGSEIGDVEPAISAEYAYERDRWKVQAFGNHLCSNKNVCFTCSKFGKNTVVTSFVFRCISVHT